MLIAGVVVESLLEAFGNGFDFVLLSDLVADSSPTHITGAKVFLIDGFGAPAIVKIAHEIVLRREMEVMEKLPFLGSSIRFPRLLDFRHLPNSDMSALVSTFEGLHTLDVCRIPGSAVEPESVISRVLSTLAVNGLFWSGLASRNIIVRDRQGRSVSLVDWERGYEEMRMPRMPEIYARSIELIEETSALLEHVCPYWSSSWPSLDDLRRDGGRGALFSHIEIEDRRDSRTMRIRSILDLPSIVTDSQYFRMIEILCSATEQCRSVRALSYACDQIEYFGGLDLRIKASLLAHYIWVRKKLALAVDLRNVLTKIGSDLCRLVHASCLEEVEANRTRSFVEAERHLARIGADATGIQDWWQEVVEVCRQYVLIGANGSLGEFRVLAWIPE